MMVPTTAAPIARLERMLGELDERNRDNVSRTESYLELYALSRAHPPELPWLLLAHLVSRNAGYMMTGIRMALEDERRIFAPAALEQLFLFLERANYLIFYDAWYHVIHFMAGRHTSLREGRTARFVCEAYRRHAETPGRERELVADLVTNEQNYIHNRVVHHSRFRRALALVQFFEASGAERTLMFAERDTGIRVGGFALLERRIAAGLALFDAGLADPVARSELYRWASEHPHTGSRADHGGRTGPSLRDAWPAERVAAMAPFVHEPPAPDPLWP